MELRGKPTPVHSWWDSPEESITCSYMDFKRESIPILCKHSRGEFVLHVEKYIGANGGIRRGSIAVRGVILREDPLLFGMEI